MLRGTDDDAELKRLRIENEALKAKLIAAKGSRAREPNWEFARLGILAYLADKAREAGFGEGPDAIDAYREAEKRKLKAQLRAEVAADPSRRASILKVWGAAYLEPDAPAPRAEPAKPAEKFVRASVRISEPAASRDFADVYLPPTVATPEAIARAQAKAEGKLVDLPTNATARAIVEAMRKAEGPD
jgi:hypothetical protein